MLEYEQVTEAQRLLKDLLLLGYGGQRQQIVCHVPQERDVSGSGYQVSGKHEGAVMVLYYRHYQPRGMPVTDPERHSRTELAVLLNKVQPAAVAERLYVLRQKGILDRKSVV